MTNKYIIVAVIALIAAGGIFGGYKYLFAPNQLTAAATPTAPSGSIYGTAKVADVVMQPSTGIAGTAGATTTSILNTDLTDRMITTVRAICGSVGTSRTAYTGTGLASWQLSIATTTTSNPTSLGSVNLVSGAAITVATATPDVVISSSTPSISTNFFFGDRWAAGTPLTFSFNATNTAACTVGVSYTSN